MIVAFAGSVTTTVLQHARGICERPLAAPALAEIAGRLRQAIALGTQDGD